jgi:hypothetical protein
MLRCQHTNSNHDLPWNNNLLCVILENVVAPAHELKCWFTLKHQSAMCHLGECCGASTHAQIMIYPETTIYYVLFWRMLWLRLMISNVDFHIRGTSSRSRTFGTRTSSPTWGPAWTRHRYIKQSSWAAALVELVVHSSSARNTNSQINWKTDRPTDRHIRQVDREANRGKEPIYRQQRNSHMDG